MTRNEIDRWLTDLHEAWQRLDPGGIARLFTENVTYRPHPHRPPLNGRDEVARYWRDELAGVKKVEVSWQKPIVDGLIAAVEYQASISSGESQNRDHGVLLLRFDDGLCSSLVEYWMLDQPGPD